MHKGQFVFCLAGVLLAACSFNSAGAPPTAAATVVRPAHRASSSIAVYKVSQGSREYLTSITQFVTHPIAMAFDHDYLYVANQWGSLVVYETPSYQSLRAVGGDLPAGFSMVFDREGDVFTHGGSSLDEWAPGLTHHIRAIEPKGYVYAMAVSPDDRLYVATDRTLDQFDVTTGKLIKSVDLDASNVPGGPMLATNTDVYVSNRGDTKDPYLFYYSQPNFNNAFVLKSHIYKPSALGMNGGHLYVASNGQCCFNVTEWNDGRLLRELGDGRLDNVHSLAFDKDDNVYAAQSTTNSVYVYGPKGTNVIDTLTTGISRPCCLALDRKLNRLYVANQ